jgi:sigma-B regulation protein RsbU (phosphoserine phosphatase)
VVDDAPEQMECMEVWGGAEPIARQVRMQGLDAWVYSRPFRQADSGGDVYYASSCATGRISRLLLADVSGHGSAVAGIAATLRGLMRRFVNFIDQTQFVRAMNAAFVTATPDGVFATAVVCTFFAPTNRLTVCNAGHPQPLWYRAAERRWSLLRQGTVAPGSPDVPSNMPLGILDLVDYEQSDVEMGPGDLMLIYTDALSEAADTTGEMLGELGLLRSIQELGTVPPAELIDQLLGRLSALSPGNLSDDDVTVLLLRPRGRRPTTTLAARARGMARLAWAVVAGVVTRPTAVPLPDLKMANVGGAVLPWLSRLWRAKDGERTR